jgi:OOP family OmpA-OmpF porin
MPSSERRRGRGWLGAARWLVFLALGAGAAAAQAQQVAPPAPGFAVERFYPSAAGGGWLVMDDLDMHGAPGGAMSLTTGYARNPLRVTDGGQRLGVVSDQAFADFGLAVTYRRWRVYLDLDAPLWIRGSISPGVPIAGHQFTSPHLNLGSNPDTLSDPRLGADLRLVGEAGGRLRFGVGAQLIIPSGGRAEYDTDDTVRAMLRALVAGDLHRFSYAGQLGLHLRPLDDAAIPGSPQGSELLFGVAGGARVASFATGTALLLGPEIFGATAFRSLFGSSTTALEGLLTARLEGTADRGRQLRVKLGAGAGLHPDFGAPEWRLLLAIEVFDRGGARD